MSKLWNSSDSAQWLAAREKYWHATNAQAQAKFQKSKTPEKDREDFLQLSEWYSGEGSGSIRGGTASPKGGASPRRSSKDLFVKNFHTHASLIKVAKWKSMRGTFRPGLLQKVEGNKDVAVKDAWYHAIQEIKRRGDIDPVGVMPDFEKTLNGVGPATASALFAPLWPDKCAFMSDEAMIACNLFPDGKLKYTPKAYADFNSKMIEKAQALGPKWTAEDVQRALWANAVENRMSAESWAAGKHGLQGASKGARILLGNRTEDEVVALPELNSSRMNTMSPMKAAGGTPKNSMKTSPKKSAMKATPMKLAPKATPKSKSTMKQTMKTVIKK